MQRGHKLPTASNQNTKSTLYSKECRPTSFESNSQCIYFKFLDMKQYSTIPPAK